MVLEILGAVTGVGGSVIRLVDHGVKLAAAEEDMVTANMFLSMISEAADSLRHSRDELLPYLTIRQKQQIQSILFQTDSHLNPARRVLNRKFIAAGQGAMLGFLDRLHWVYKDKGTMTNYQIGLLCLHTTLSAKHTELNMVRIIHVDHKSDPQNHLGVIFIDPNHERSSFAAGPNTRIMTLDAGNNVLYSSESELAIDDTPNRADTERTGQFQCAIENVKLEETEIEVEFLITTFLKRRYTERARREITSKRASQPASMSIEVEFSITAALQKRYTERAKRNNADARSNLELNFWRSEKGVHRQSGAAQGTVGINIQT